MIWRRMAVAPQRGVAVPTWRCFSAAPQEKKSVNVEDLVKETLKKMMSERDEQRKAGITDEDLAKRFQHYEVSRWLVFGRLRDIILC